MKKKSVLIGTMLISTAIFGQEFNSSKFENNVKKQFGGIEVKVETIIPLQSHVGLNFVISRLKNGGDIFPVFSSDDARAIIGVSPFMGFENQEDRIKIEQEINKIRQIDIEKEKREIAELIKKIPIDNMIILPNTNAQKITYIVTDPECPYCRKELSMIGERMKDAEVRLILAPVHQKSAFIKSQIALNEAKMTDDNIKKIEILNKVYSPTFVVDTNEIDIYKIEENYKKIFSTGAIKGVPYILETEKGK